MYYYLKPTKFGLQLVDVVEDIMPTIKKKKNCMLVSVQTNLLDVDVERTRWFMFPNFLPGYWNLSQVRHFVRAWEKRRKDLVWKSEEQLEQTLEQMVNDIDSYFDNGLCAQW